MKKFGIAALFAVLAIFAVACNSSNPVSDKAAAVSSDSTIWGAEVSDLQTGVKISSDGKVTGNFKYYNTDLKKTDWNSKWPEGEREGFYAAIQFTDLTETYTLGGKAEKTLADPIWLLYLGDTVEKAEAAKFVVTVGGTAKTTPGTDEWITLSFADASFTTPADS